MISEGERPLVIVGADATLGRQLALSYEASGASVWKTTRQPGRVGLKTLLLDLSGDVGTWRLPTEDIDTAFLCAAVTSQSVCQRDPESTTKVNVSGCVGLARRLCDAGTFVIFMSTNLVFDGEAPFVHPAAPVNPRTEYGRQKAEAEKQLLQLGNRVAIVRFGKILGPNMPLIRDWISDLRAGNVIHPFSDMVMAPISLPFAVRVLKEIARRRVPGIIHASATDDVSYAEVARYIARDLGADKGLVRPISFREAGVRFSPRHTTMNSSRLVELGLCPPPSTNALEQLLPKIPS